VPLWRNIIRLGSVGALQGVKNPGQLDVVTPAQAVQIVDDVSRAVAPVNVPQILADPGTGTAVGSHSGIEFIARGGGLWLMGFWTTSGTAQTLVMFRNDDQVVTSRGATVGVTVLGTPDAAQTPESAINDIRIATAAIPTGAVRIQADDPNNVLRIPLFIRPGEHFFIIAGITNTSSAIAAQLREIPSRDPAV